MISSWWFAPAPRERLAAVRILVGLYATFYALSRLREIIGLTHLPASHFAPVGLARLTGIQAPVVVNAIAILAVIACALFTVGYRFRIVGPIASVILIWLTSYKNSWGMVFHTENLLVMQMLALACTPAGDAYALFSRRPVDDAPAGYGWGLKLVAAIAAVCYV
ncbi:MAG TPA: hypothetical protein VLB44_09260, partial [Kofleriaceae bacterium]|nr:hypothetical protein [Kofleriaceae bacterium]